MQKVFLILGIFLVSLSSQLFAQSVASGCAYNLEEAKQLFKEGKLFDVIEKIRRCKELHDFETPIQDQEAYRLTILSYLFSDMKEEAEKEMYKLLLRHPEYKMVMTEHEEFKQLYESFRNTPLFSYGAKLMFSYSLSRMDQYRGVNPVQAYGEPSQTGGLDYEAFGLVFSYHILPRLSLSLEGMYNVNSFTYDQELYNFSSLNTTERLTWLELPLIIQYRLYKHKKFRPYIGVGASVSYLLDAQIEAVRSFSENLDVAEIKGSAIGVSDMREPIQYSGIVDLGVAVKMKRSQMLVSLRAKAGLMNLVKQDMRFQNSELTYKYGYVSPDFTLNVVSLNVAFLLDFYKPKLL